MNKQTRASPLPEGSLKFTVNCGNVGGQPDAFMDDSGGVPVRAKKWTEGGQVHFMNGLSGQGDKKQKKTNIIILDVTLRKTWNTKPRDNYSTHKLKKGPRSSINQAYQRELHMGQPLRNEKKPLTIPGGD